MLLIDTAIGETGINSIIPKFKQQYCNNLETITLSGILLKERTFKILADVIGSGSLATLKNLNLSRCQLSKECLRLLCESIKLKKTPNIKSLHLSCIYIYIYILIF